MNPPLASSHFFASAPIVVISPLKEIVRNSDAIWCTLPPGRGRGELSTTYVPAENQFRRNWAVIFRTTLSRSSFSRPRFLLSFSMIENRPPAFWMSAGQSLWNNRDFCPLFARPLSGSQEELETRCTYSNVYQRKLFRSQVREIMLNLS